MSLSLYKINEEIEKAIEMSVDKETGEIKDFAILESLEMQRTEKALNIAKYIKTLLAESEAIKRVEQGLRDRRQAMENKAERIKGYLSSCVQGEKIQDAEIVISWRKSQSVNITETAEIPEQFKRIEIKPDKAGLKQALKDGIVFEGITLEEKESIQIK